MAYYDLSLQRKQEIENNLLALMQDTPYDQIPVKALTDHLQIARKTFYHYFHNKQACLESLMDRLILESSLSLVTLPENSGSLDVYRALLGFWIRNRAFLEAIHRNNLTTLFTERAMQYILQEDHTILARLSGGAPSWDEDVLYYYISGQVCLILKWCREGFTRPLEEMARISLRLALEPMLSQEGE